MTSDAIPLIVMPVRNRLPLLASALRSLRENTPEEYKLTIVDDASSDGMRDAGCIPFVGVRESIKGNDGDAPPDAPHYATVQEVVLMSEIAQDRQVEVIRNERQLGIAKSVNRAFRQDECAAAYVKLDADVNVLKPGWLTQLMRLLAMPGVGAAAVPIAPSVRGSIVHRSPLSYEPPLTWTVPPPAFNLNGACMAISPLAIEQIGLFWEGWTTPYSLDDAEYCYRLTLAGFAKVYTGEPMGWWATSEPDDPPDYQAWKVRCRQQQMTQWQAFKRDLRAGRRPLYCP